MSIELSDDDLEAIRAHAVERLQASLDAYVWLSDELRKKLPTVTDEAISAVKERIAAGTHQDDGQEGTRAAWFCALYQLALDTGKECIALLKAGRADARVLRNLMLVPSTAFEMLARLAITLNGGPLSQRMADEHLRVIQSQRGRDLADARHSQPGGSREKHERLRTAWASGRYGSRDECAREEYVAVGLSYSTARRALRGTPEPTRT